MRKFARVSVAALAAILIAPDIASAGEKDDRPLTYSEQVARAIAYSHYGWRPYVHPYPKKPAFEPGYPYKYPDYFYGPYERVPYEYEPPKRAVAPAPVYAQEPVAPERCAIKVRETWTGYEWRPRRIRVCW